MFEQVQERVRRLADARAGRRRKQLAERFAADLPGGVSVRESDGGVHLSGRGLRRRLALDPALRALLGSLR
ncbi:MAG TPA: hypothetical protein VF552_00465 [Allosphingosinicella sp.]|jgi:hypothetical protein